MFNYLSVKFGFLTFARFEALQINLWHCMDPSVSCLAAPFDLNTDTLCLQKI